MIYTQFGSKIIKVLWGDIQKGEIDVLVDYEDGSLFEKRQLYVSQLKADDGIAEIIEAIKIANNLDIGKKNENI